MSTDRIFQGDDQQWYFNVRGNHAVGPFISFSEADDALRRQLRVGLEIGEWDNIF